VYFPYRTTRLSSSEGSLRAYPQTPSSLHRRCAWKKCCQGRLGTLGNRGVQHLRKRPNCSRRADDFLQTGFPLTCLRATKNFFARQRPNGCPVSRSA
jgi:hypothetical protein